ncbi:M48 family metallopeptidase [Streptomyces sp. CA-251387]|uniref:M48 family metallopeptidase n=1 Tax=Streptomyces sp. CA-251387 TaxID=3240064 RepID=UPI003D8F9FD5
MAAPLGGTVNHASFDIQDILHPLDLAARQQLEKIPGLQTAVKKYRSLVADRRDRAMLLSNAIRLGPRQVPDVHKLLPPICASFGIEEPELYLMPGPANAMTMGHSRTCVVIHNELLLDLPEDEIQAVLAHECGHILAEHVLYRQMSIALFSGMGSLGGKAGMVAALFSEPLKVALLDWYRKSELTADRAAVMFMGGPEELQRALFHLQGIPKWLPKEQIDYAAFAAQADEFEAAMNESKLDRFLLRQLDKEMTHPNPALRLREIGRWAQSETYRQVRAIAQAAGDPGTGGGDMDDCGGCGRPVRTDWLFCQGCGNDLRTTAGAGS